MNALFTKQEWFDQLLPKGIPTPSSILLSGPGGSGKPLIGNTIIAEWLREGGSVIFMSLQYPDHSFIVASMQDVAKLDINDYIEKTAFIELDTKIDKIKKINNNHIKANVVKPNIWDEAIEIASTLIPEEGPGILIFVSALNLLLFSPTYGKSILEKMKSSAQGDKKFTYLFSASTTAKADEIAELEEVVDHLIITRSTKSPFQLYLRLERIKDAPFDPKEILVPFPQDVLMEVKEIAEHSRKIVIPEISKI
jgi:KaiC/GvpD/RAD55 family RecA-like ATPase